MTAIVNRHGRRNRAVSTGEHRRGISAKYESLICQPDNIWNQSEVAFRRNVEFVEKPRSVIIACIMFFAICLCRMYALNSLTINHTIVGVATASLIVCVTYAVCCLPDTVLVRPHPMFWRGMHGVGLWYLMIIFMFFVTPPQYGRRFFHALSSESVDVIADKQDGSKSSFDWSHLHCNISVSSVQNQLFSLYFLAHVFGWMAKMLVIRDWILCLRWSFLFEVLELSLQWLIPEFKECWWDSTVIDFAGANMVGMMFGLFILRRLNNKRYDWHVWASVKGIRSRASRMLMQFHPYSWSVFAWRTNHDPISDLMVMVPVFIGCALEVNSFFIINCFSLVPSHPLNFLRQFVLLWISIPGVQEWYMYIKGKSTRIGSNCLLLALVCIAEMMTLHVYGHPHGAWDAISPPPAVWCAWVMFFSLYALVFGSHYLVLDDIQRGAPPLWVWVLRVSFVVAFVPLVQLYEF